ncbi:SIS domain-containing protein [Cohnella sp. GCM10020058]|uniref:SIS domain-containing protein n=1 Tax=Cohnella sp. GCM10020058 TaxID=3317330 RepID=UPI00363BCF5A
MHVSAILDEGTLLSGGALRSMAIERTPGDAAVVLEDYGIGEGDLLILMNAYGINAAFIDAVPLQGIRVWGVLVFADHSYGAKTDAEREAIARKAAVTALHAAEAGEERSCGSTGIRRTGKDGAAGGGRSGRRAGSGIDSGRVLGHLRLRA